MRGPYPVRVPTPRRPKLQLIREGNPGHRTRKQLERGLRLPPAAPPEPDWTDTFGPVRGSSADARRLNAAATRARARAREEWRRVVPVLDAMGMLSAVDAVALEDWCACVARLEQCEREVTRLGLVIKGERGWQRNGAAITAQGYRQRLGHLETQLGLTPLARDQMRGDTRGPEPGEVGSPWDV
jgi:P27 family predicted phage terminase small subunit